MEAPISGSLGAMSSLLGKLDDLFKSQYLFRKPVRKVIELLKEDLERINTILLDLSNQDDPNQTKKYWMKEVREVSYDIEDYIDRLVNSEAKIGSLGAVPRLKISKLPSTLNRLRPKIANQIKELRARLEDAGERHRRYVLDNNQLLSYRYVPSGLSSIAPFHGDASRLHVGTDGLRERLLKLLNDGEKQLKVISVFGIEGIGKTALVTQFFQDYAGQFGFRAFVKASRKPDTRSVLRSIISQTRCHHPFDAWSMQQLIACLNKHLQNTRYFIVIDDLWDTTVWDILLCAFPDGNHSSRIIITTSVKNVVMTCCSDWSEYGLIMEPLNIDDSRKLFFTRVFGSEDKFPQQFNDASYEIVRKCGGVPLAIINIAGFLASQPDKPDLWDYVQKSLDSNLSICPTTEGIVNVINLGYNGLSHCLMTCLQYVTLYPENCTIWKDDLVRRWVAEGFITPKEGNDMEAVAETYFEELVYRGMIQPAYINYNDKVLSCTVHNLVLDLLIQKSTEDNFITTIDYSKNNRELSNKIRRLFLFFSTVKYATKPSGVTLSQVRSLSFYGLIKCMPSILEFEFLRVLFLHFSGDYSGHTPFNLAGIRRLFQLRYLKVTCNFSLQLPTQIEGLYHLETLELDAKVTPLPADIVYMKHLLHLRLPSKANLPDEIGRMKSLRTLKCFDLCSSSEDKLRSLEELTNLQELQLICTEAPSESLDRNLNVLCSILGSFCYLKSLALVPGCSITCSPTSVIDSSSTSSPPVCLERFEMHPAICSFSGLPEWIRTLRKLCILKISVTEFLQNDMDSLGGLLGLTVLSLHVRRPIVDRFILNSGVFPALKCFKFRCDTIFGFVFQEAAIPNLRRLKLCFKAHGGQNALITMAGNVHLLNLQEIAIRVGVANCAEQYHRRAAETAFQVTIIEHRRKPNINVQYVDWDDDDNNQQTCSFDHAILEQTPPDHTNKNSDSRISISSDMTISSSDLLSSHLNEIHAQAIFLRKYLNEIHAQACLLRKDLRSSAASRERRTKSEGMNMVSAREDTIHEVSSISELSNYDGVLLSQVPKEEQLEHKVSSQKKEILQQKNNDALRQPMVFRLKDVVALNLTVSVTEFSYREIKEATNKFDYSRKIGEGRFARVYMGSLRSTDVAIKIARLGGSMFEDPINLQVQTLSRIRHPNLITLIGVCREFNVAIYEFFANGSLEDHLQCRYQTEPLSWRTRIRIAVDICRALVFLHSSKPTGIVHGNMNPRNIYLDDNHVVKLGYFEASGALNIPITATTIFARSVRLKDSSSVGFMDPTYWDTGEHTTHSDVYSFGVVMMQLLTAMAPTGLCNKVKRALSSGTLHRILDSSAGDWPPECADNLARLAVRCCRSNRMKRPDLGKKAWPILRAMLKEVAPAKIKRDVEANRTSIHVLAASSRQ